MRRFPAAPPSASRSNRVDLLNPKGELEFSVDLHLSGYDIFFLIFPHLTS